MNFSALWRTAALIAGFSVLGISSTQAAEWPRQITDSRGVHTLEQKPTRIVSTSVTLTGSLLAIDAPVIASGAGSARNCVPRTSSIGRATIHSPLTVQNRKGMAMSQPSHR